MFKPTHVSFDFETALLNGSPSTEAYRPDFRAISCAFAWRNGDSIKTVYKVGEYEIACFIEKCCQDNITLIAHNVQFEYSVLLNRFPKYINIPLIDTMRLVQVYDNGGSFAQSQDFDAMDVDCQLAFLEGTYKPTTGLSLNSGISRILPIELHGHKKKFKDICTERGGGLDKLNSEELEEYNTLDAIRTLQLYETITEEFTRISYDWKIDHAMYLLAAKRIAVSKGQGVRIDEPQLNRHIVDKSSELANIVNLFNTRFKAPISELEAEYAERYLSSYKSEKGRLAAALRLEADPIRFNTRSGKQMKELFIGKLGFTPKFFTKGGKKKKLKPGEVAPPAKEPQPSFAAKFLAQFGEGGLILKNQKKLTIEIVQGQSLKTLGGYDGRWHIDLKAAGAATGRMAGGSHESQGARLNAQGMSRRCKSLMSSIVADEGYTLVSRDLSAGEPTVTTYYSRDPNYHAANFGMIGKAPYYTSQGVLMLSDIYLMTASVSPMHKHKLREAFNTTWSGNTFAEQWLINDEVIKDDLKASIRQFCKILALGLSYSMSPKKMVESAYDAGYTLELKDAKTFYDAYWNLFRRVRMLGELLKQKGNSQGHLVNEFGYRLTPDSDHKWLNYWIQSSVTGLMHVLTTKFMQLYPQAKYVTTIHDEDIYQIPTHDLANAKRASDASVESLNRDLNWSVKMRCGWKPGTNLYEAK